MHVNTCVYVKELYTNILHSISMHDVCMYVCCMHVSGTCNQAECCFLLLPRPLEWGPLPNNFLKFSVSDRVADQ